MWGVNGVCGAGCGERMAFRLPSSFLHSPLPTLHSPHSTPHSPLPTLHTPPLFEFRQNDLRFLALAARQAEHRLCGTLGRVVQETFVDVPDLFDAQRAKADALRFAVNAQVLQRPQQVQHRAVVDRQWIGRRALPARLGLAAFQIRKAVGVEQVAGVGGQLHPLMLHAAEHGPEGGEQPRLGIEAALKNFFTVVVGGFLQLGHKG